MIEREGMTRESQGELKRPEVYHIVHTKEHGALWVKLPPELSEKDIVRVTVGELPGGELIVNLYTERNFGYAYNVTCPRFSEWGYLPD